jgi:hypothetical protein
MKNLFTSVFALVFATTVMAQNTSYWQQHVDYVMDIDMDVKTSQYKGTQKLTYTNNSPDTLNKVFYHLYFNAFQPGSEMDVRLQTIKDPDARMVNKIGTKEKPVNESRISVLKEDEIGFIKVNSLTQNGAALNFHIEGTVLEVILNESIKPGGTAVFEMDFLGQVPLQIRRSGRDSKENVALSMTQWYPKLAEYDFEGWHADAYIGREFHGVWGNFDVTLHIDKKYTVGGSGYLQNANEIGHGYEDEGVKVKRQKGKKLSWHFVAPNVHDFTWAADPKYTHDVLKSKSGTILHFLYKKKMDKEYLENWKNLQSKTDELLTFYNENIGKYPYKQYSVIQGGDGGMEYAMCTLVTGERKFGSLVGVVAHEMAHSWFQFLLATNESKHPWMDEGFTTYISNIAENEILKLRKDHPNDGSYSSYMQLVGYDIQEPLTTHADCYAYNYAYGISSYSKGAIFLEQLGYVIGEDKLAETIKKYFADFKFKHPTPNDIKRTAEKVSGINLDWYLNNWIKTTNVIDYGVSVLNGNQVILTRKGSMPMPMEVLVTFVDGSIENFYIPLTMMRGEKESSYTKLSDWSWVAPQYSFLTEKQIQSVVLDYFQKTADIDKTNNIWPNIEKPKKK